MSKKVRNFAPVFEREKVMEQAPPRAAPKHFPKRPGGGMVDAVDSKSAVSNGVRVQVPPGVLEATVFNRRFIFYPGGPWKQEYFWPNGHFAW